MASNNEGSPENTQRAKVDRISSLPNELLSYILSLLPTKCAVGTSILSNRWKYLWTSITSFDLKGPPEGNISQIVDFTYFVDKVFRDSTSSQIQKFSLYVPWDDKTRITTWINEAVKRNAREVNIAVPDIRDMPLTIFSCKTVSVLTFSVSNWFDNDTVSFELPCLKVLHIKWRFHRKDFLEKLISSCPVLEDLTLVGHFEKDENFMVSSPALKSLRLQPFEYNHGQVTLSVNAPYLEYLHLHVGFALFWSIKGDFSSLVKASIHTNDPMCFHIEGTFPQSYVLPMPLNFTYLEVFTRDSSFGSLLLPHELRRSPSLEAVSLDQLPDLLVHGSECRTNHCQYSDCMEVKRVFRHGVECKLRSSGGCVECRNMWFLVKRHARACRRSECTVPWCSDIKESEGDGLL